MHRTVIVILLSLMAGIPSSSLVAGDQAEDMKPNSSLAAIQVPQGVVEPLAVTYLQGLAEECSMRRKRGSIFDLTFGGAAVLGGSILLVSSRSNRTGDSDELDFNTFSGAMLLIAGAPVAVVGLYGLTVPSPAERSYAQVCEVPDPTTRGRMAFQSLKFMGRRARLERLYFGAGYTLIGLLTLVAEDNGSLPISLMGLASGVYYLVFYRSLEEQYLENYQEAVGEDREG